MQLLHRDTEKHRCRYHVLHGAWVYAVSRETAVLRWYTSVSHGPSLAMLDVATAATPRRLTTIRAHAREPTVLGPPECCRVCVPCAARPPNPVISEGLQAVRRRCRLQLAGCCHPVNWFRNQPRKAPNEQSRSRESRTGLKRPISKQKSDRNPPERAMTVLLGIRSTKCA